MKRRPQARWIVVVGGLVTVAALARSVEAPAFAGILSTTDPAQIVPLDKISPAFREGVSEVIRDHTFHRKGAAETFPCNPRIYLALLNEPTVTLALWQDLSPSPVVLRQVGPNRYEGNDGAGAAAVWDYVYRSPKLNILFCNLNYTTPRGNAKLDARLVLVVHSGYYREVNGENWVQHDIEAFVKVDSKGWKAVARTVRPVIDKLLEEQVREAGYFVSLMGRLVAMYPNWAVGVVEKREEVASETRDRFKEVVVQTKRAGAFSGRPTLADSSTSNTRTR